MREVCKGKPRVRWVPADRFAGCWVVENDPMLRPLEFLRGFATWAEAIRYVLSLCRREDYGAYAALLARCDYWERGLRARPNFRAAAAETWRVLHPSYMGGDGRNNSA